MKQQNLDQDTKKTVTIEITWRTFGYLGMILVLGIAIGLLLYPLLTYPAIGAYVALGLALLLMALTALLLRKN